MTEIHVDGFGVLCDFHIENIAPGLSIICGPNEAGKSTLLDFVRGVLFGFANRRSRQAHHVPLRGGRHGGSIRLADDDGAIWTLARHVDARQLVVSAPDGSLADDQAVSRLLAGADDALFRSVFAFGLGELASFETLERDEVRELIFSAGVLGAGRSATQAIRTLEARRATLVRARQPDATANQLRTKLEEIDNQLRAARTRAEGFATLELGRIEHADAAMRTRQETADLRQRLSDLERLASCWPNWNRLDEARTRLDERVPLSPQAAAVRERSDAIEWLEREYSGHDERVRKHGVLAVQRTAIERELAGAFAEFAGTITAETVGSLDVGPETSERISDLVRRHQEATATRRALEDQVAQAAGTVAHAEALLGADAVARTTRPSEVLRALSVSIREVRQLVIERSQLIDDDQRTQRDLALCQITDRRQVPHDLRTHVLAALVVGAGAAIAAALGEHHELVLAIVAAGVLALGYVLWALATRSTTRSASDPVIDPHHSERRRTIERLGEEIAALGDALEIDALPSIAEIEGCAARLENEQIDRRRLDDLERDVANARGHLAERERALRHAEQDVAELDRVIAGESVRLGLDRARDPRDLLDAMERIRDAQRRSAAAARVRTELDEVRGQIARFEELLRSTALACGLSVADAPTQEEVMLLISTLSQTRKSLDERIATEADLATSASRAERDLAQALGAGEDAERLEKELASGTLIAWEDERRELLIALEEQGQRYDELLAATRDAERAIEELSQSDEIARLELERESVSAALDAALVEWTELGVAKALLEQTLARYERDRQPAVIARAGELFAKITDGRYRQLVARESEEGARRHGIEVISANGSRIDSGELSRGTAEQLYLCLRLAFAVTFSERAVSLPLVLDDVLVNFDPERAQQVARAIAETARSHQVLAFTCHPHLVDVLTATEPTVQLIEMSRTATV